MLVSVNLAVNLGGLGMKNPYTVASGTFGSGREYAELWARHDQYSLNTLGALTTKGVSLEPWVGNPGVRIAETASGMLNSIGLQNPGVEHFCHHDLVWLSSQDVPVIVNVSGHRSNEYAQVIRRLEQEAAVAAYEVNISCPNVDSGGMSFGTDPDAAAEVVVACRKETRKPLLVKLTPNVTDITQIACAVQEAGADALSLINTVAGMAIDPLTRTRVFERGVAGLSGPAIKPVALLAVYRTAQVVSIPILGMGGIRTVTDVVEFLLAGATAVAIGTASFGDPFCAPRLVAELAHWCETEGVRCVSELTRSAI
ncbi:MAG: dihydroorotate dehydrogenase [Coriobacteriia bacterium]|nr:dihydroorotate dehydrogenase [Coriobacteriia bacterium]